MPSCDCGCPHYCACDGDDNHLPVRFDQSVKSAIDSVTNSPTRVKLTVNAC